MLQAYVLFRTRPLVAILIVALVMWSLGLPSWIGMAQAANVSNFSDTLSTSAPGEDAVHTLEFTLVTTVGNNETIVITFDPETTAFDLSALAATDVTISGGSINQVAGIGGCAGVNDVYAGAIDNGAGTVTINVCAGATISAATIVTIVVGDVNLVGNPVGIDSYVIRLGGTMTDSGDTRVAIVDTVSVTAIVETIFDFSVHGLGEVDTFGGGETITGTTTATSIPFGIIGPGNEYFLMQELRVDTNAYNGFTVTVESDQTLTAGNGAEISTFVDGADTPASSEETWDAPANTFGSPDTYGHWGITSSDPLIDGTDVYDVDGVGPYYAGNFVANPIPVFYHGVAASYSVDPSLGESFARIGYKVEIGTLQEAGNDYQATIMYIATPVF